MNPSPIYSPTSSPLVAQNRKPIFKKPLVVSLTPTESPKRDIKAYELPPIKEYPPSDLSLVLNMASNNSSDPPPHLNNDKSYFTNSQYSNKNNTPTPQNISTMTAPAIAAQIPSNTSPHTIKRRLSSINTAYTSTFNLLHLVSYSLYVFMIVGSLAIIPSLIPIETISAINHSNFEIAIKYSKQVYGAMIGMLAAGFPMICCHLYSYVFLNRNSLFTDYVIIFVSLVVPPSVYLALESACIDNCHIASISYGLFDIMSIWCVLAIINIIHKKTYSQNKHPIMSYLCILFSIFYVSSMVLHSTMGLNDDRRILVAYCIIYLLSIIVYFSLVIRICLSSIQKSNTTNNTSSNNNNNFANNINNIAQSDAALISLTFSILMLEFSRFATSHSKTTIAFWSNYTEANLTAYIVIQIIFVTFLFAIPRQLDCCEQEVKPSSRWVVRRMSHEARAPLDLMGMGLNILTKMRESDNVHHIMNYNGSSSKSNDGDKNNDSQETQLISSLVALCKDVKYAVNQPMEDLSINPTSLVLLPFINKQIQSFEFIANARKVNLQCIDSEAGQMHIKLNAYISIDVKLVTQVIQNILSHLMKITSSQGTVVVALKVLPKEHLQGFTPLKLRRYSSSITSGLMTGFVNTKEVSNELVGCVCIAISQQDPLLSNNNNQQRRQQQHKQLKEGEEKGEEVYPVNTVDDGRSRSVSSNNTHDYLYDSHEFGVFRSILELSSHIVTLHGGNLSYDDKYFGSGSVFSIELPLYEPTEDVVPEKRVSFKNSASPISSMNNVNQTGAGDSQQRRPSLFKALSSSFDISLDRNVVATIYDKKHILVVDDALMTRKVVSQIIAANGDSCDVAVDGAVAVNLMKKSLYEGGKQYDAVLVDYMMPNIDGPTTIELMKSMGYKGIIVGMSGNSDTFSVQEFMAKGADDVIMKPIVSEKIRKVMNKLNNGYTPGHVDVGVGSGNGGGSSASVSGVSKSFRHSR